MADVQYPDAGFLRRHGTGINRSGVELDPIALDFGPLVAWAGALPDPMVYSGAGLLLGLGTLGRLCVEHTLPEGRENRARAVASHLTLTALVGLLCSIAGMVARQSVPRGSLAWVIPSALSWLFLIWGVLFLLLARSSRAHLIHDELRSRTNQHMHIAFPASALASFLVALLYGRTVIFLFNAGVLLFAAWVTLSGDERSAAQPLGPMPADKQGSDFGE